MTFQSTQEIQPSKFAARKAVVLPCTYGVATHSRPELCGTRRQAFNAGDGGSI
jgi:hypothetical protein